MKSQRIRVLAWTFEHVVRPQGVIGFLKRIEQHEFEVLADQPECRLGSVIGLMRPVVETQAALSEKPLTAAITLSAPPQSRMSDMATGR
jgi:hypothetical protein